MVRLSKEVYDAYMKEIMGKYENPDDCADMITALRSDYGESCEQDVVPKEQYDALKEKYTARFFGGDAKIEEAKKAQKADVKNDMHDLSYDDLFKSHESYKGKDEE